MTNKNLKFGSGNISFKTANDFFKAIQNVYIESILNDIRVENPNWDNFPTEDDMWISVLEHTCGCAEEPAREAFLEFMNLLGVTNLSIEDKNKDVMERFRYDFHSHS